MNGNALKKISKWAIGLITLVAAGFALWEAYQNGNLLGYSFKGVDK